MDRSFKNNGVLKTYRDTKMTARIWVIALSLLLSAPVYLAAGQSCTDASGNISVTVIEANAATGDYSFAVSNSGNGNGNRLETAFFEIGGGTYSNASVAIPTWSDSNDTVAGWNAIRFDYVSGQRISGGAVQTFSYTLSAYIDEVRIRTLTRNGAQEDLALTNLSAGCTLPAELVDFSVVRDGADVVLSWETLSETLVDVFVVQKNVGAGFETAALVPAVGSAHSGSSYRVSDAADSEFSQQYRLMVVGTDGSVDYSAIVELAADPGARPFLLSEPFPNPASGSTNIEIAVAETAHIDIDVIDVLGRVVASEASETIVPGETARVEIGTNDLARGIYLIVASSARSRQTRSLIVTG